MNVLYFFGRVNSACDKMLAEFERVWDKHIMQFDAKDPHTLTERVLSSIAESVSHTSHALMGGRLGAEAAGIRPYRLTRAEPDWSRQEVYEAVMISSKLPPDVSAITSGEGLRTELERCFLQVASQPFARGGVRLAYRARQLFESGPGAVVTGAMVNGGTRAFKGEDSVVLKEVRAQHVTP